MIENYQKELELLVDKISKKTKKPSLLLHACCAPCSSYCVEYLNTYFDITLFFYNPNMSNVEEFDKRFLEFEKIQNKFNNIKVVKETYNSKEFFDSIKGLEDCKEGGVRCYLCYKLRLEKTAKYAKENGYDYFASTLSISPYKNADKLNELGRQIEKATGVKYLVNDFKKKGGYLRSIELSKELGLYRQNYCGCIYSKREVKNNV